MEKCKDVFLFSCYTGPSYIDVKALTPDHLLKGIDGNEWLFTKRIKTDEKLKIPLLPQAKEIIKKYEDSAERRIFVQKAGDTIGTQTGKGIKRKLKAVDRLGRTERKYVHNRLHVYSRRLIDFCIKHRAGTLILLNQEEKTGIAKEEGFVLRNWSYCDLITKIEYKAKKAGLELIID